MTKAEIRARAAERRAADEKFFSDFEQYMLACLEKPGFKLESEQQLAERFGVTRYKIRKAIARLNTAGILSRKKHGGSTVAAVDEGTLTGGIDFQFRLAGYTDPEYAECAAWLLTGIVPALCERMTPKAMGELLRIAEDIENSAGEYARTQEAVLRFFDEVVRVTGNRIVTVFTMVLERRALREDFVTTSEKWCRVLADTLRDFLKAVKKEKVKKAQTHLKEAVFLLYKGA